MKSRLHSALSRFAHDASGATAIEYSIIAAGIACVIAALVTSMGSSVKTMFVSVSDLLN